jgi:hypothetical protein
MGMLTRLRGNRELTYAEQLEQDRLQRENDRREAVAEAHRVIALVDDEDFLGNMPGNMHTSFGGDASIGDNWSHTTLHSLREEARLLASTCREYTTAERITAMTEDLLRCITIAQETIAEFQAAGNSRDVVRAIDRIGETPTGVISFREDYERAASLKEEELEVPDRMTMLLSVSVSAATTYTNRVTQQLRLAKDAQAELSSEVIAMRHVQEHWQKLLGREQEYYENRAFDRVMNGKTLDPTIPVGQAIEAEVIRLIDEVHEEITVAALVASRRLEDKQAPYLAAKHELQRIAEEELAVEDADEE